MLSVLVALNIILLSGSAFAATNSMDSWIFEHMYTYPNYDNDTTDNGIAYYLSHNELTQYTGDDFAIDDYSVHSPLLIYLTSNETVNGTVTLSDNSVHTFGIITTPQNIPLTNTPYNTIVSLTFDGVTETWNVAAPYVSKDEWPSVYFDIAAPRNPLTFYQVLAGERSPVQASQNMAGFAVFSNVTTGAFIAGYTITSDSDNTIYAPLMIQLSDYQKAVHSASTNNAKNYDGQGLLDLINGSLFNVANLLGLVYTLVGFLMIVVNYWPLWLGLFEAGTMVLALDQSRDILRSIQIWIDYNVRAFQFLANAAAALLAGIQSAAQIAWNIIHALIP
jgi:hypothetical protein